MTIMLSGYLLWSWKTCKTDGSSTTHDHNVKENYFLKTNSHNGSIYPWNCQSDNDIFFVNEELMRANLSKEMEKQPLI